MKDRQTTIRLSEELKRKAKMHCIERGFTFQYYVTMLLDEDLNPVVKDPRAMITHFETTPSL